MRDTRGTEPGWLVEGMIPRGLPALLFGAGASGKGYLAVALAVHVAAGGAFLGRATKQGGVLYADWEVDDATFRRRALRVAAGLGLGDVPPGVHHCRFYQPLSDVAPRLETLSAKHDIDLVIIEAAAAAVGGKMSAPEGPVLFFNALNRLPAAKLVIAHSPKRPTPGEWPQPMGSTFWEDAPRMVWHVAEDGGEDPDSLCQTLMNLKANESALQPDIHTRITFEGSSGPVVVQQEGDRVGFTRAVSPRASDNEVEDLDTTVYLPSPDEVRAARTARGGYTRAQLAEWGVPWPPPQGWKARLEQRWHEAHPDA